MLKLINLILRTVTVWVSRRKQALEIGRTVRQLSLENRKLDNAKLGFQSDSRIFVSKNLTPYNQHLAWKCRELKRAGKIHSCWSAKGVVKIRKTMNEHLIAINHETDIASLSPDFVFKVRT